MKENLPKYVVRSRGTVYFRRREKGGGSAHWVMLVNQFEEGATIPQAALDEVEGLIEEWQDRGTLRKPKPIIDNATFFHRLQKGARSRSKRAGRDYTLPDGWAEQAFIAQGGKCYKTGLEIRVSEKRHDPWAASIERLDPSKGYTEENCALTCYIYNCAKNQFTDADLLKLCRAIARPPRK